MPKNTPVALTAMIDCRHHRQRARAYGLQRLKGGGAPDDQIGAVQHAKDKIRANSVHPGVMPPMRTSGRTADPAVRTERMRFIPMRRPGEVDEVAYAILFLASDRFSLSLPPWEPAMPMRRCKMEKVLGIYSNPTQRMTAAGGILHEEFHSPAFSRGGRSFLMV